MEVCWYFEEAREQFRISGVQFQQTKLKSEGQVEILGYDTPLGAQVFENEITESARATLAWPEPAAGQLVEGAFGVILLTALPDTSRR